MKHFRFGILLLISMIIVLACTIVKHESQEKQSTKELEIYFSDSGFDPKAYVESIWEGKVLPCIDKRAADITEVLSALKASEAEASKKYGYRIGYEGTFYNFAVKGKVKILRVNTESRNGLAYADVVPFDGKEDVLVQIGPVFKGTSIRDMLDFISLNSFANQVEFARLASELNARVREKVIGPIDPATMVGKIYSMTAVFTLDGTSALPLLTPVVLVGE
jgi:predicted lipoprotein